jgi:hypothetical protein
MGVRGTMARGACGSLSGTVAEGVVGHGCDCLEGCAAVSPFALLFPVRAERFTFQQYKQVSAPCSHHKLAPAPPRAIRLHLPHSRIP